VIDPRAIVIDASTALSIVLKEPEGPAVTAAITQWTKEGARLIVPSHFWLEVTNALTRGRRWGGGAVLAAIHDLDQMGIETVILDRAMLVLVIDLGERHGLSAYDAAYLALAASLDASLVTLDSALRQAAGTRAIHIGPAWLSETPAPHEHAATWPSYKGASAYLAKLRAEAARPG
jgi:predicted nucleic acid-binding protein